jgi:hypothetical protein
MGASRRPLTAHGTLISTNTAAPPTAWDNVNDLIDEVLRPHQPDDPVRSQPQQQV